ncbi:MAG: CopG family antitoxin [Rhodoferax sp.]
MKKQLKTIPKFADEVQERAFWDANDSTDHLDWSKAKKVTLPNLKPLVTAFCPKQHIPDKRS